MAGVIPKFGFGLFLIAARAGVQVFRHESLSVKGRWDSVV